MLVQANSNASSIECGPTSFTMQGAGIRAFNRIAKAWGDVYSQSCPSFKLELEEDTWSDAGARVCDNHLQHSAVHVAGMAGKFFRPQASTIDGWKYDCYSSDRQTKTIKIADEGVGIVTSYGGSEEAVESATADEFAAGWHIAQSAQSCIQKLGGGLTMDQLRWIFSSKSLDALAAEGMNVEKVVPHYDGRDDTHLWSELHANCSATPILLAGIDQSLHHGEAEAYLRSHVLFGQNEDIRQDAFQTFPTLKDFAEFLEQNENAIGYTSIGDFIFASQDLVIVAPVAIQSRAGAYVLPSPEAFLEGNYPLSDRVTVGLWNTPEVMAIMRPFLRFGLSEEGSRILTRAGYWPITGWERVLDETRLGLSDSIGRDEDGKTGISFQRILDSCGPKNQRIEIAGSPDVHVIARTWDSFYLSGCPTIKMPVETGGSSVGAARVCANRLLGSPVDIGTMSRSFKPTEGVERTESPGVFDCTAGDEERSAIQIDVAYDGITVIVKQGSIGDECQQILGGGISMHQLRWIYSSYSDEMLEETGWDPNSLKNSDGDSATHLWSELDSRCAQEEINLAGDKIGEGTYDIFKQFVLTDGSNGETIDVNRRLPYAEASGSEMVAHLWNHRDTIGFIGYDHYYANLGILRGVPLQTTDGEYIAPSAKTISDRSYPIVRNVFMNLHNDPRSLANTIPYVKFGLENPLMVETVGLVPLQGKDLEEMMSRLNNAPFAEEEEEDSRNVALIIGLVVAGIALVCLVCTLLLWLLYQLNL